MNQGIKNKNKEVLTKKNVKFGHSNQFYIKKNLKIARSHQSAPQTINNNGDESNNQFLHKFVKQNKNLQIDLGNFHYGRQFRKKVQKYKTQRIVLQFINKLRRSSVNRKPIQYTPMQNNQISPKKGFFLDYPFLSIYFVLSIASTIFYCIQTSLNLIFSEIFFDSAIYTFNIYGIIWMMIQIVFGFTRINTSNGIMRKNLDEIAFNYLKNKFFIDVLCFFGFLLYFINQVQASIYLKLVFFLKIPDTCQKIYKLQTKWISSFYLQKYWILTKILIKNFFFAHLIALFLIIMASLDDYNWLKQKQIDDKQWIQQYSWAYYWATNIMLTVGFGDLNAANYKEAVCLIFIETISCLTLAYNISCIGSLLGQLKQQQMEKEKNIKIVKNLQQKNGLGIEMSENLNRFVEESVHTEQEDDFNNQSNLIQKLPQNLLRDFKNEANLKFIKNIEFLQNFSQKIILKIAHQLESKIVKPGAIIISSSPNPGLSLLQSGQVGYYANQSSSKYKNIIFDNMKSSKSKQFQILSYQFLSGLVNDKYMIKSKGYTVIQQLAYENFREILLSKMVDFEYFFKIRDKYKNSYSPIKCQFCQENHIKLQCPKLHFNPIKQIVIYKFLQKCKIAKNQRKQFVRKKLPTKNTFVQFISAKNIADSMSLIATDQLLEPSNNNISVRSRNGETRIISKQKISSSKFYLLRKSEEQDNFWLCETDKAENYKYYFPQNNPSQIQKMSSNNSKKMQSYKKLINSSTKKKQLKILYK